MSHFRQQLPYVGRNVILAYCAAAMLLASIAAAQETTEPRVCPPCPPCAAAPPAPVAPTDPDVQKALDAIRAVEASSPFNVPQ